MTNFKFYLKDKIIQLIGNLSREEIDKVTAPDLNELTPYQQLSYIVTATNMERKYFIGLRSSDDKLPSGGTISRYGTFSKFIRCEREQNGIEKWEVFESMGTIPGRFIYLPPLLTKEEFSKKIKERYRDNPELLEKFNKILKEE